MARAALLLLLPLALCTLAASTRPLNITLNRRPEGVTAGPGSTLFASRLLPGGVVAVDVRTGAVTPAVPDRPGRSAVGMWHESGALFVDGASSSFGAGSGGGPPSVYVYDVGPGGAGEDLAVCPMGDETSFLNDVVVENGSA